MLKARHIESLTRGVAAALLAGPWEWEAMLDRSADALGRRWRWRRGLIRDMLLQHPSPVAYEALVQAIAANPHFRGAINDRTRPHIVHWFPWPTGMAPRYPAWHLPVISSVGALAALLDLPEEKLHWLADCEHRQGRPDELLRRHYRHYWLRKPSGGWRLVEEPHYLLKQAQRGILHGVLDRVPPHPAACAFVHTRSVVDYAAPHVGRELVLHLDLKEFFPSIPASRVHAMLTTLGYPTEVARLVTGLCTSTVPGYICRQRPGGKIYSAPHLPQGAPTSPALANLAAYRLDGRLAGAAASVGACYTRYADDLAFSGDEPFARSVNRFQAMVWRIVAEEGFDIHHRKTRLMHKSVRQRLCGLVVNDHLSIDRRVYDRLKAILTNCLRHGLESQNRDGHSDFRAHLCGRVAFVEQVNPARGARLRDLLKQVA
ncbi:MAG: RNA-directed DNA polymerase [Verrucomicrobia bacterium]|jgi:RNA-directed DNA polymerase|nr:RNA-directed DNA polymerase [Verrucomicrobiota bacterium]MBT7064985.1 RNA-directed DNA polymerase [Verrucomicrobiota bacterium]MBT7700465.1 RNA-directed DNA polymerase [Verrucomicrobiota bacterium]